MPVREPVCQPEAYGSSTQQEINAGCLDLYLPSWYKASHIPTGSSFPSPVFLKKRADV